MQEEVLSLDDYFSNATRICKKYASIKTYQLRLLPVTQSSACVKHFYLVNCVFLQKQENHSNKYIQVNSNTFYASFACFNQQCMHFHLQYDNSKTFFPDYDEEIQMILANETYPFESVFSTLRRDANFWSRDTQLYYPKIFNSSTDIQYIDGLTQEPLCQQYYYVAIHNTCQDNESDCCD